MPVFVKQRNPIRHKNRQKNEPQRYQLQFVKQRKQKAKTEAFRTIFQSRNKHFREHCNHLPTTIGAEKQIVQEDKPYTSINNYNKKYFT